MRVQATDLIFPAPTKVPLVVSWAMFFCRDVSDFCTLARSADSPLFSFVVTTPHHRCSVANMAWDPLASVGRVLTILKILARGANCTDVHLARLIAGVQKAGLDVDDISLASGSADFIGYEVSPANTYCSGTGKRMSPICSVARTVSSRRRMSEGLVNGRESFLTLSNRGALSILDASFKFARTSDLTAGEPWPTLRG